MTIYAGEITAEKLIDFASKNSLETELAKIDLRPNMIGVDPRLGQSNRIAITIPREKIAEITKGLTDREAFCVSEKDPAKHHFVAQPKIGKMLLDVPLHGK